MILVVVSAVGLVYGAALRREWRPAVAVHRRWERSKPGIWRYLRFSPATFIYLSIVVITTWVLLGLDSSLADAVLRAHSSNLSHLRTDPLRVLIRSAFWVDSYALLPWVIVLAVVLAPAERWLGTRRWLLVFITGHVGATLLTALGLWLATGAGVVSGSPESSIDVGVSYGFAAVAAVFTYRLPGRLRTIWAMTLAAIVVGGVLIGHTFTDFGHLVAVTIGFAMWPLTRARSRSLPAGEHTPMGIWLYEVSNHPNDLNGDL